MRLNVALAILTVALVSNGCSPASGTGSQPTGSPSPSPTPSKLTKADLRQDLFLGKWVAGPEYSAAEAGIYELREDDTFTWTRQEQYSGHPEFGTTVTEISGVYRLGGSAMVGLDGTITFGLKSVKLSNGNAQQQPQLDAYALQLQQQMASQPDLKSKISWEGAPGEKLILQPTAADGSDGKPIGFVKKL